MPNTYACKGVSNPNVPIFLPRVCTLVLFIIGSFSEQSKKHHKYLDFGTIYQYIYIYIYIFFLREIFPRKFNKSTCIKNLFKNGKINSTVF